MPICLLRGGVKVRASSVDMEKAKLGRFGCGGNIRQRTQVGIGDILTVNWWFVTCNLLWLSSA